MSAQDYPVTTPWGYSKEYPLNGGRHKGEDRAMPENTPIVVGDTQLGLSGNTGYSTGPHLHTGKWINGTDINPQGGGFVIPFPATITSVDKLGKTENGKFVTLNDATGVRWVYLHMNQIDVQVGQVINQGDNMADQKLQAQLDTMTYQYNESQKALKVREQLTDTLQYQLSESEKAIRAREQQALEYEQTIRDLQASKSSDADKKLAEIKKLLG